MQKIKEDDSWHWSQALSVGVEAIDDDHKKLFKLFNKARSMCESGEQDASLLYEVAQELVLYMQTHFDREEAVMKAAVVLGMDEHFAAHSALIEKVQKEFDNAVRKGTPVGDFIVFLKELFVAHIQGNDQGMAEYTKGFEEEIDQALLKVGGLTLSESFLN